MVRTVKWKQVRLETIEFFPEDINHVVDCFVDHIEIGTEPLYAISPQLAESADADIL